MKTARIYIAGKLNDMTIPYIGNMRRMILTAKQVRDAGFAVYVPCLDILEGLVCGDMEYSDFFDNGQAFLAVCDAVMLTHGWETSKGTQREIEYAKSLGIPVFEDLGEMVNYFNTGA